jgi:hypothetical protein
LLSTLRPMLSALPQRTGAGNTATQVIVLVVDRLTEETVLESTQKQRGAGQGCWNARDSGELLRAGCMPTAAVVKGAFSSVRPGKPHPPRWFVPCRPKRAAAGARVLLEELCWDNTTPSHPHPFLEDVESWLRRRCLIRGNIPHYPLHQLHQTQSSDAVQAVGMRNTHCLPCRPSRDRGLSRVVTLQ